jgi:hypothetical protein
VAVALLTVVAVVPADVAAQSGAGVTVSGLDPTSTTVTKGETATVSADVENTGGSATTAALELVVDPGTSGETVLATKDVGLDGGETETVTFGGVDVGLDPGTYDYVVRSADDSSTTGTMTVREPATFAVDVDEAATDGETAAGTAMTVAATVTNTGDVTDTQTVELAVNGTVENTTDVTLDGGGSTTVSLDYTTATEDAPHVDATVRSDDAFDTTRVDVLAPAYAVELTDATTREVVGGENATLVAEVTNVGNAAGTETVTFEVGDATATRSVSLDPDGSETVSVSTFATTAADAPSLDAAVRVGDAEATTTVTVLEPATFPVEIADRRFDGGTATVTATVTNAGDVRETETVTFEVDGESRATDTVTLGPDGSEQVRFSHEFAPETAQVDATVRTGDDFATTTVARANVAAGPTVENVTPPKSDGKEPVTVTYTAAGDRVRDVRLLVEGPDGAVQYNESVATGRSVEATVPASVTEAGEGQYDVTVRAVDRAGRTVSAVDAFDIDATYGTDRAVFGVDVFRGTAGDLVQFELVLPQDTDAYVLVGGDRTSGGNVNNYLDLLYVQSDDGRVTVTVNTRLVGTDVASERAYTGGEDTVVSYAHEYGAGTEPEETTEFSSATFVDSEGNEVAETLAGLRERVDIDALPRPIQPARYRLVAGADDTVVLREDSEIPDMANPLARSNLVLTEPEIENVTTHVLPRASADELTYGDDNEVLVTNGNLDRLLDRTTQRDTVAIGDRLVLEVEATGLYGALLASTGSSAHFGESPSGQPVVDEGVGPAVLADLLGHHEGVELEVEQTNPGQNREATRLRLDRSSAGDIYLIPDVDGPTSDGAPIERFYVVVDTRETPPFTAELEDDDRFGVEFAYESPAGEQYDFGGGVPPKPFDPAEEPTEDGTEHYPYFRSGRETESVNTAFTVETPSVTYDRATVDGDDVVVTGGSAATLSGRTNVAPGSEVTIQLVSDERTPPEVITIDGVTIASDGTFSVNADLSALDPGADVDVEFYVYQQLVDRRPAVVVEAGEDPVTFEVADLTERRTVTRGDPVGTISTTIRNTGTLDGRETVTLRLDGETVGERTVLVQRGRNQTLEFEAPVADLEPGEYRYTVVTPDDEAVGTLVVESGERATATPATTPGATNGTTPQAYDDPGSVPAEGNAPGEEQVTERGFPGVPFVRPRDALGGLALVGSVYVLGGRV